MKVLIIASSPADQPRLRVDREDRAIAELARQFSPSVLVERLHASQIDDIHALILDGDFDVIHLSGHGDVRGIYLERADYAAGELVDSVRLASLLRLPSKQPLLAVFLCCYSDDMLCELADVAPFAITAKCEVPDEACVSFSQGLYEWLFRGHGVQESFDHAKGLVRASGLDADPFTLSRRSLIGRGSSFYVECKPDANRDSILVNLDAVLEELDQLGTSREEVLHSLSRKISIHHWIFARPRDNALIPIGRLLFGEFSWQDAADVVYCNRILKLRSQVQREQWQVWSRLLVSYNDLASCEYRSATDPTGPHQSRALEQAVRLFRHHIDKYLKSARAAVDALGCGDALPHIEFALTEIEQAEDQLDLERYPQVVAALERALTSYHEVANAVQPPEETWR